MDFLGNFKLGNFKLGVFKRGGFRFGRCIALFSFTALMMIPVPALAHAGHDMRPIGGPFSSDAADWTVWTLDGPLSPGENRVIVQVDPPSDTIVPWVEETQGQDQELAPWEGHDGFWLGTVIVPSDGIELVSISLRDGFDIVATEQVALEAFQMPLAAKVLLVLLLIQAVAFVGWLARRIRRTWFGASGDRPAPEERELEWSA